MDTTTPMLEAFSRQLMNSHVAINRVQLKTWLIFPDDVRPSSHTQVLPPPCPVYAEPAIIGSQQGFPKDPGSMVTSGRKSIVNRLTANMHSILIPLPLSEGASTLKAAFTDHSEEYVFLAGCDLSESSCWLPWFQTSSGSLPQEDAVNVFCRPH